MTGSFPSGMIDHINGVCDDNRWSNLRQATRSQNAANQRIHRDNTLGMKGVYRHGKRFAAKIRINGDGIHLGTYDTPEEAHSIYCEAAAFAFDDFARAA